MVHDLSAWRSARKKSAQESQQHKQWSALHMEELFSVLKAVEQGRGSVMLDASGITVSGGYGVEIIFHDDGSVRLGDGTCSVAEKVHFIGNKCFSLLDGPTLLRLLGLLLLSVADGTGFVEWSAGFGMLYSDAYRCWVVFSSDGAVEFNGLSKVSLGQRGEAG